MQLFSCKFNQHNLTVWEDYDLIISGDNVVGFSSMTLYPNAYEGHVGCPERLA